VDGGRLPPAGAELFATAEESARLGHLGPDPLGADWDAGEALRRRTADPDRSISEALLDQRVITGIGNVWRCAICFLRGLAPDAAVRALHDPAALVASVRRMFEANRHTGNHVTTGAPRHGHSHYVSDRAGLPCRRCRTAIRRSDEGERATYWCPSCQR
jgi:endonuclease-8